MQDDIWTIRGHQLSRGRLDDKQRSIENAAKGMFGRERQIVTWVQENVYGRRESAASAVAQRNDELEAAAEVLNRILQASKHFRTQSVTGNADDKEIVRSLIE